MKKIIFLVLAGFLLNISLFAQEGMGKQMEMRLKKMSAALSEAGHALDDTQYTKLTEHYQELNTKMKALRSSGNMDRMEVDKIRKASDSTIQSILTPEQYTIFSNAANARGGMKKGERGAASRPNGGATSRPSRGATSRPSRGTTTQPDNRGAEAQKSVPTPDGASTVSKEVNAEAEKVKKEKPAKYKTDSTDKAAKKAEKMAGKEAKKVRQSGFHAASMANVDKVSNMLASANMPLSDTQGKELKSIMMREQKKIGALVEKSGEGSKDYVKGLKKIKKGSVKKMKDIFSSEQFKFIKKQWK